MLMISQVHSLLSVIRVLKRSNPVQVIVQNASEGCFFFSFNIFSDVLTTENVPRLV